MHFTKPATTKMRPPHRNEHISIARIGEPDANALIAMYDQFEPLGEAFGLPPYRADVRRVWIQTVLKLGVNLAARLGSGRIVGHGFLAGDRSGREEIAIFVDRNFRRRGIGTNLVNAALQSARTAGKQSVWSSTPSVNRASLRLQQRCGFRVAKSIAFETEMVIDFD